MCVSRLCYIGKFLFLRQHDFDDKNVQNYCYLTRNWLENGGNAFALQWPLLTWFLSCQRANKQLRQAFPVPPELESCYSITLRQVVLFCHEFCSAFKFWRFVTEWMCIIFNLIGAEFLRKKKSKVSNREMENFQKRRIGNC